MHSLGACSVQYIIHCASNIRFDLPIQRMLAQNFAPTQELALLAARLPRLRCFTYMSTAFVNANQPKDAVISERHGHPPQHHAPRACQPPGVLQAACPC